LPVSTPDVMTPHTVPELKTPDELMNVTYPVGEEPATVAVQVVEDPPTR
jgi:hypothetical protein